MHVHPAVPEARSRQLGGAVHATFVGLLTAGLFSFSGTAAFAHGGEESDRAFDLVGQGIAYRVTRPHDSMDIHDKINNSLEAKDTSHVDLAYVRQPRKAFKSGDLTATASCWSGPSAPAWPPPRRPGPDQQPTSDHRTETGTLVVADPLPGRGALHAGDWGLPAASVAAGVAGIAVAIRIRPHHTHRISDADGAVGGGEGGLQHVGAQPVAAVHRTGHGRPQGAAAP
ncbi:hypothetical protein ACWC09_25695 [Streptomyces sp. NPDC001617]